MRGSPTTRGIAEREMHRAHEAFLTLGPDPYAGGDGVRPVVLESWQRALSLGVDPDRAVAPVELQTQELSTSFGRPIR